MLQKVKRGLLDVATSRKRLELQGEQLQAKAAKLHEQAKRAMAADREDLAREALTRRAAVEPELEALRGQHAQLLAEETKLTEASKKLSAQVEAFRTRKETIKATYTAAEAQTKIGEALSGISEEMGDIGLAVQRAEDKTLAMQSRAGAIDELLASGALDDLSTTPSPPPRSTPSWPGCGPTCPPLASHPESWNPELRHGRPPDDREDGSSHRHHRPRPPG